MTAPAEFKINDIEPDGMIGALKSIIHRDGCITIEKWNSAVKIATEMKAENMLRQLTSAGRNTTSP